MYTLNEIAAKLKISRRTLNRIIAQGHLKRLWVSKNCPRITQEELNKFLGLCDRCKKTTVGESEQQPASICEFPSITLKQILTFFLHQKRDKRSAADDQLRAKKLLALIGNETDMQTFNSPQVRRFIEQRQKQVSNSSVNRELALLSAAINLYNAEKDMKLPNPVKGKMLREPQGRVRWLKHHEADKLIAAARLSQTAYLADFIILALHTGARRGELLGLTWNRIDFDNNLITLEEQHTKNRKRRCIPLNNVSKETLKRLKRKENGHFVFCDETGQPIKSLQKSFMKACERANIENFHIHDLRHTCAAWLVMAGTDLMVIRDLLGHQSVTTTEIYAHLDLDRLRQGLTSLDTESQKEAMQNCAN